MTSLQALPKNYVTLQFPLRNSGQIFIAVSHNSQPSRSEDFNLCTVLCYLFIYLFVCIFLRRRNYSLTTYRHDHYYQSTGRRITLELGKDRTTTTRNLLN